MEKAAYVRKRRAKKGKKGEECERKVWHRTGVKDTPAAYAGP